MDKITATLQENIEKYVNYENISNQAISRLNEEFPQQKEKIETLSGAGHSRESLLAEFDRVFEADDESRAGMRDRYSEILNNLHEEYKEAALEQVNSAVGAVAKFNVAAWGKGRSFYFLEDDILWGNIFGVLMTAALPAFGAPFWFERLQDVLKLRDVLSKGIEPVDKGKEGKKKA